MLDIATRSSSFNLLAELKYAALLGATAPSIDALASGSKPESGISHSGISVLSSPSEGGSSF